jgi:tetratricopeptide (TPR) repeat protein
MLSVQDAVSLRSRLLAVIALHQGGRLGAAVEGYRAVLEIEPRQFDALRLLGAALIAQGKAAEALPALDRAMAIRANLAEVWALRGEALAQVGQREEAIASFERALALDAARPQAWAALALQLQGAGRDADALAAYDRAVALDAGSAVTWTNRGLVLSALGRHEEALQSQDKALALAPGSAEILANRGKALHELQRHAEALIDGLDRAAALAPDKAPVWSGRAAPLRALGRLDEALESSARALALDPRDGKVWAQHGALLIDAQRFEEAKAALDRAVQFEPGSAPARFNRGALQLLLGEFADGWEGYESREVVARDDSPGRRWDGAEPLEGKTLLLVCEQGLGDSIQFCRFAPLLAARAGRVLLTVPPPLLGLARSLGNSVQVLTDGDLMPPVDLKCLLLSVPHRLRLDAKDIPAAVPYLAAPATRRRAWRERLAATAATTGAGRRRLRIGLVCSGNPAHGNDRHRSIELRRLQPLAGLGAELHLLQKELRADDEAWLARLGVVDHRAELTDLAETAALASCMDVVVSVDTSVAHLAGAIGRPLCLLLPANPDWRWMLGRDDSPWYPTARLFRQERLGEWDEVVERVAGHLRALTPGPSPARGRGESDTVDLGVDGKGGSDLPPSPACGRGAGGEGEGAPAQDWWEDPRLLELERLAREGRHDAAHQFNLGLRYLALGRFERGWDYYEWRMCVPELHMPMPETGTYWDGSQELAGRTILLCHEQGLGDVIQFARFAPWLAQRGARVVLGVPPALQRLMRGAAGVDDVVGSGGTLPPFDLKCLLLSCAQRFAVDEATIPATVPYLAPPEATLAAWRERLGPRTRLRIGLAVSGNANHGNDAKRSIALERFGFLREIDAEIHLLQREVRSTDEAALAALGFVDHREDLEDLAETAALIACLDLVVSVDTSVAHLSGALGVPLHLLLAQDADWRWMAGRDDSPWYPSAQLHRQAQAGDWDAPLARLAHVLRSARPRADAGSVALPAWERFAHAAGSPGVRAATVFPPDLAGRMRAGAEQLRNGQLEQAADACRYVLLYEPRHYHAHRLLAAALLAQGKALEALPECDAAIAENEDADEVWAVRASAQERLGRLDSALADWERAVQLRPDAPKHWSGRGRVLAALGRPDAACTSWDKAVERAPDDAQLRCNRALALLAAGVWTRGWEEFEWRLRVPGLNMVLPLEVPVWDGRRSLQGRTVLVSCEQGLGDAIQFARFLPRLAEQGARVVFGVPTALRALLQGLHPRIRVVGEGEGLPFAIDYQCWLLSLPHRLGADSAAFAHATPYLRVPEDRLRAWRADLPAEARGGRARIGIVCSGNPQHANDANRSIPLARLAALRGVDAELHLLQERLRPEDEPWLERLHIRDHRARLHDLADTAALASCMDAVVSVDTAVAHLAGALGLRTFVLLPADPDWRWQHAREDCPWYPTARLFRQRMPGAWEEVLERLGPVLAAVRP